jgi:hypothetical protein
MVGNKENKKGNPTIRFQCLDLMKGAKSLGVYRNQGKDKRINKLLSKDKILRPPSSKAVLISIPFNAICAKQTSKPPDKDQHKIDSPNHIWPKSSFRRPI